MTFFPPDPEMPERDETEPDQPQWLAAPENELPALLPVTEIIATTDHVAIALIRVAVYRSGVALSIERRLRRNGLPTKQWHELSANFMEHGSWGDAGASGGRLRFGLVLGDGERVLADYPFANGIDPSAEPAGHTLTWRGGGGSGGANSFTHNDELWLWPAPPVGSIEFVMQWPALGIDEHRLVLDGNEIREVASQARPLWP